MNKEEAKKKIKDLISKYEVRIYSFFFKDEEKK